MAERLLEFIKLVINRNGLSGYPVDAFEQSPQKGALCVICKRVASDPMFSIDCGHRYCTKCLAIYFSLYHNPEITYDAVKAAANSIPDDFEPDESVEVQCAECDCGKTLTFSDFNPDRALGKQLARLQCKCPSKGCDFTSLFLPFVDHFQICEYTEVECPYCVHCFARSDLPVHMAKCDHRPELRSVCTYCKLPIATAQMQSHLRDQCIKFPTSCRYCRTVTSRSQLKEHEQDCNLVDRCSIGCDVTEPIAASKHFIDNEALHLPIINEMLSAFKSKSYSALQLELSKPKCTEVQLNETYLELLSELSNMHSESSGLDVASFDPRRTNLVKLSNQYRADGNLTFTGIRDRINNAHQLIESLKGSLDSAWQTIEENHRLASENHSQFTRVTNELEEARKRLQVDNVEAYVLQRRAAHVAEGTKDGNFTWRIDSFRSRCDAAKALSDKSIYSPSFYTAPNGYKLRLRLLPNGDSKAEGRFMSLFVVLCLGEYDAICKFPFSRTVEVSCLDQRVSSLPTYKHASFSIKPEVDNSAKRPAYERPRSLMNPGFGVSEFLPLANVAIFAPSDNEPQYVKDDVMFIRVTVEPFN